jgi:hypothetical protein
VPSFVRCAPALLAVSACFNPIGVDTSTDEPTAGTTSSTASATSTPETAASTEVVTTAPTTEIGPLTTDPSTTSSTTGDGTSGTTGPDCGTCRGSTPVCDPATLDCVQCLTNDQCPGGDKAICDPDSHSCRGCLRHSECALACERDIGVCFPPDQTAEIEVSTEQPCPPSSCIDQPCCSVSDAIDKATALPNPYVVIRLAHGTAAFDSNPIHINELTGDGKRIAILGGPGLGRIEANIATPLLNLEMLDPAAVQLKTKLYLSHLQISGGAGVRCSKATRLRIDDSTLIANGSGTGLQVSNCTADVERTTILNNAGGIEAHAGAIVGLVNTIVGGSSSQPELRVDSGSQLSGVYVTVADHPFADGSLLNCPEAADVTLRNSIFVAGKNDSVPNPILCDTPLHLHHSAVAPPTLVPKGESNFPVVDPALELPFKSWAAHDYLLDPTKPPGSAFAAIWTDGDPKTDINGTLRPTSDGTPDYAGADVP